MYYLINAAMITGVLGLLALAMIAVRWVFNIDPVIPFEWVG